MELTAYAWLAVAALLLPLLSSVLIWALGERAPAARNAVAVAIGALSTAAIMALYPAVMAGEVITASFGSIVPPLGLSLRVDSLSFLLAAIAAFIWTMATIYSLAYMEHEHRQTRYYTCLILAFCGCLGVFLAGDLFTFFLFFELMSLSAYVLVVHEETPEAMKAGYKYLIMTIIGGLALFIGIAVTYQATGTLALGQGGLFAQATPAAALGFVGYLIGFGIKAGMVPVHIWLPDAHPVAPSPASALLSGLMIKTGAYGLLRVIYDVYGKELIADAGWNEPILWLGAVTVFLGSAVAITQNDLKKRLAYSSVGQMGYVLIGLALLTPGGTIGAVLHIFSHAFMKATLFLCAGAIIYKSGERWIPRLGGIGHAMPVTMAAFTLASLAMIGVPPLNAFLSKWQLSLGALEVGRPGFVLLLLLSSFMNMAYYMPIVIAGFFGGHEKRGDARADDAPWLMLAPIIILALANIVFNVIPWNLPLILSRMAGALWW